MTDNQTWKDATDKLADRMMDHALTCLTITEGDAPPAEHLH